MKVERLMSAARLPVMHRDRLAGELVYRLALGGETLTPRDIRFVGDHRAIAEFTWATVVDRFEDHGDLLVVHRKWTFTRAGPWKLTFRYRIREDGLDDWIVPSVVYDANRMGQGRYPRGGLEAGWSFREDRTPLPGLSILAGPDRLQAVWTSPARDPGDLTSTRSYIEDYKPCFEIRLPHLEGPRSYTEKGLGPGGLTKPREGRFQIGSANLPASYERTFFIMRRQGIGHPTDRYPVLITTALDRFGWGESEAPDWEGIAARRLHHLRFLAVDDPADGVYGPRMGRGNGLIQRYYEFVPGSFLGRGVEAAVIFARAAEETADPALATQAERMGRFFLTAAMPGGGHQDIWDLKARCWGAYRGLDKDKERWNGCNARSMGEMMIQFHRLQAVLAARDRPISDFTRRLDSAAGFFLEHQLTGSDDGCFGRWWDASGGVLDTQGTNGAYVVQFLAEWDRGRERGARLDQALSRAAAYYGRLMDANLFHADTLDADCVDKEAGVALLSAFLRLFERDPRPEYLDRARQAAGFVLSWLWTYDTPFPPGTPAAKWGLSTRGLTAVSVAHHHLDFYGGLIGLEFLRLAAASGEDAWRRLGLLMLRAANRLVASRESPQGRSRYFLGWQPEQVNHTNWDYIHHLRGAKGHLRSCVAWNTVLNLGALLEAREAFPDLIDFRLTPDRGAPAVPA